MSTNFVPYEKMSKKEKRKINSQKRGAPMPAPKVIPDKRKKIKDNYNMKVLIDSLKRENNHLKKNNLNKEHHLIYFHYKLVT